MRDIGLSIRNIGGSALCQFTKQCPAPPDGTDPPSGSRKPFGKTPSDPGRGPDNDNLFHAGKDRKVDQEGR